MKTHLSSSASCHRSYRASHLECHSHRPERWENPPEAISSIPGVWGHLLSFLGGPRACIGYRFSLIECVFILSSSVDFALLLAPRALTRASNRMKAIIYTLVRAFEFELAVPADDVQKKSAVVQRPILKSDPEGGSQMPLLIKPYRRT